MRTVVFLAILVVGLLALPPPPCGASTEVTPEVIWTVPYSLPGYWTAEILGYPAPVVDLVERVAKRGFHPQLTSWCGDADTCYEEFYAWEIDDKEGFLAHYLVRLTYRWLALYDECRILIYRKRVRAAIVRRVAQTQINLMAVCPYIPGWIEWLEINVREGGE